MEFGITIPLQKFLKWKQPSYGDEPRLFFCWDVHRADINGRKMLVVVNAATRFAGVRTMTGADWRKLDSIVPDVIDQAMETDGIPDWVRQKYFDAAGAPTFTKTHGRKAVGGMNRMVEDLWFYHDEIRPDMRFQSEMTEWVNQMLTHCATRTDYVVPREAFGEDMEFLINEGGFGRYLEEKKRDSAGKSKTAKIIKFPGVE
ncbi:MAG: DUF6933 domain-containing protein [Raoultibacter sp.]|jgi:hypothetical protein